MPPRKIKHPNPPQKGDVLAECEHWTIYCNEPGYTLLLQYDDGKKRFLSHAGAVSLTVALLEALRRDPRAEALSP